MKLLLHIPILRLLSAVCKIYNIIPHPHLNEIAYLFIFTFLYFADNWSPIMYQFGMLIP